jgi:hypothetical protein
MALNDFQVARKINRQDHPPCNFGTTATTTPEVRRGDIRRGYSDHTTVSYARNHPPLRTADASNDDAAPKPSEAGKQATQIFTQMMGDMEELAQAKTPDKRHSAISKINEDTNDYCIQMISFGWDDKDIKDYKKQVANKIADKIKESIINNEIATYKDRFTKATSRALIPQIYDKFRAYISLRWPDAASSSKEIRTAIKSLTDELGNKLTATGEWESGEFEKYFTVLMQASTNLMNKYPEPAKTNQSAQK